VNIDKEIISAISCLISFLSFIFLGIIAFLTLKHTAKPKLKIILKEKEKIQGSYWALPRSDIELKFYLLNKGHLYAKPAIINLTLYVNLHPSFEPLSLFYGSVLEHETKEIKRGKNNSKYLVATGIKLYHKEPGEYILLKVRTPKTAGTFPCWISARADHDDLGYHYFPIKIL